MTPSDPSFPDRLYRLAVEGLGDGLWCWTVGTGKVEYSASYGRLLGYPDVEQFRREFEFERAIHPDDHQPLIEAIRGSVHGKGPVNAEFRLRSRDGSYHWYMGRGHTLPPDETCPAPRFLGLLKNIDARKQAELALRASEARWMLMDETEDEASWSWDAESGRRVFSEAWYRMMGYEPGSMDGDLYKTYELVHPDDRDRVTERGHAVQGGARPPGLVETRVRHADGSYRWIAARSRTVERDADGRPLRMVGVHRDVTSFRQTEDRLAAAMVRLNMAVQAAGLGVWEVDYLSQTAHWDARTQEIYGADESTYPRRMDDWVKHVHQEDIARLSDTIKRARAEPDRPGYEVDFRIVNGRQELRWVRLFVRFRRNAAGEAIGAYGVAMDTTELRRLRDNEEERLRLLAASQAKTDLLARVSHELRTPLNAMLGMAQILQEQLGTRLTSQQFEYIEHLQTAGWHLTSLVDDLLDIAGIDQGQARVTLRPVALSDAVSELGMLQGAARKAALSLHFPDKAAIEGLSVQANPRRLRQILLNLLSNSLKYTPAGGRVELAVDGPDEDGMIHLNVIDNGPGMSAEQLAGAFEPFNRLGMESSSIPGAGLGLPLARTLASEMGGELLAESRPGEGSRFSLVLPAAAPERNAGQPDTALAARPVQPGWRCALLVEDNSVNQIVISELLRLCGVQSVITAASGTQALSLLREHDVDIALLDMNLPDMTGLDVLVAIRADERLAQLPSLMITADAAPALREHALRKGVSGFLTKPVALDALKNELQRLRAH
ncbi:MAG TPA: PAS domain-containing protein [Burkholderiaceae bacterium]|nr:PAS domain-containing protein [Burkholderiaceae bacterium]